MVKYRFQRQTVNYKKRNRPSDKLVPDQSISIKELVDKFTRQVPVEISQREKAYVDQGEGEPVDLEKLANLSPVEKAFAMGEMREEAEALKRRLDEERASVEQAIKEEEELKERQADKTEQREEHSIPLDNTMLDDTGQIPVSKKKGR